MKSLTLLPNTVIVDYWFWQASMRNSEFVLTTGFLSFIEFFSACFSFSYRVHNLHSESCLLTFKAQRVRTKGIWLNCKGWDTALYVPWLPFHTKEHLFTLSIHLSNPCWAPAMLPIHPVTLVPWHPGFTEQLVGAIRRPVATRQWNNHQQWVPSQAES